MRSTPIIDEKYALEMIDTVLDNNCFGFGDNLYTIYRREGSL